MLIPEHFQASELQWMKLIRCADQFASDITACKEFFVENTSTFNSNCVGSSELHFQSASRKERSTKNPLHLQLFLRAKE